LTTRHRLDDLPGQGSQGLLVALALWGSVAAYLILQGRVLWASLQISIHPSWVGDTFRWEVLALNTGRFLLAGLVTALVAAAYVAVGRRLARWMGLGQAPLAIEFALGALALALGTLGLGLTGLWFLPLLVLPSLVGAVLALRDLPSLAREARATLAASWREGIPWRVAWVSAGLMPLLALALGAVPDILYDTQVYHLAVPETWLARHGMVDLPERIFAHFPYLGESMLLPGAWFTAWEGGARLGTEAPRLMGWVAWGMTATLAGRWAGELASPQGEGEARAARAAACLLVMACPLLCVNDWTAQVETTLVAMALCFLYALDRALPAEGPASRPWAWTAGALLGATVMVKYNGVLVALVALPFLVRWIRGRGVPWRTLAWMGGAAALVAAPWLIKNLTFAGNPVYPYLSSLFEGRSPHPVGFRQMLLEQREWQVQRPWDWFTLPWRLVMASPTGYNFVGPLALASGLALLLSRRKGSTERVLAWGVGLGFVGGWSITHLLRFEAVLFPPMYVAAAVTMASRPFARRQFPLASAVVSLACAPVLLAILLTHYSPQGMWLGRETREAYLRRAGVDPYGESTALVAKSFRPGERVLVAGDARTLGYGRDLMASSVFDEPPLVAAAREGKDAAGVAKRLRRLGVDGVLVHPLEGLRVAAIYPWYELRAEEWGSLASFFERDATLVGETPIGQLFRVGERAPGTSPVPPYANTIALLDPAARWYMEALQRGVAEGRDEGLADLSERQAFNPQWLAEWATWKSQTGREAEALEDWRRASERGLLSSEQYGFWHDTARKLGREADAALAKKRQGRQ